MQFSQYLILAAIAVMPTLALPAAEKRSVAGAATLNGRSYLIVKFGEVEGETLERRGVAGDKLIGTDGVTYILVPETK